ncbi:PREDICTED: uncharacterized protein LOC109474577 [Branchiostoma belcheri]|uniref:Uncharacterized protein LOC109474577 n=1 Tax=Branchiostoma belcheri TaxID=7741 RepID=A0A6P4Z1Q1_BRABE|nr:PREDICTED: uncharacterized protein LOC109474577 [Branchiostoma belcheri]
MESLVAPVTAAAVSALAAGVSYLVYRRFAHQPSWPKGKQNCAYAQKVVPKKKKIQLALNSLEDFTPSGESVPVHDVAAFFTNRGNEFSTYGVDWEQEAVVLIRPVDGTDMKKHPFFREAQRRNAAEVLVIPFSQLQAAVDSIADKIAHVQEVFVYMTARCGSTLLLRAVEATSVAQSCNEPEVLDTICLEISRSRRKGENPSSHHTGQAPAVLLNDATAVELLKNVVSLLSYNLVTSDPRHRSVIFYKLQSGPLLAADAMYRAFPTAKTVFLYRNGVEFYESWTRLWCRNQAVYRAFRSLVRFGLWRWVPEVPHDFRIVGDDPKFSTVRYHGSYYHYVVARWLSGMQRAVEVRRKYPEHFFHAVVNYTALARDKQETLHLLMKKLEIEWNPEDMKEERKRLKKAFAEDSQSGTFLSHRSSAPGEKWAPCTSPSWIGEWEREYISHVCRESGNDIPGPDFILPDSIV